ncbi:proteasome activator [Sanguibacter antarcticus]|uniref:Bacterial proteasome activator n=1 Tax=Sanguibacter antarcticus TaxID=372484 RepID=A0A2A9E7M7_9MICO|nr:proteasome activator [Sanguibacter antarcticus]PFG34561.1 uncharacterized protein DUF2587 [Sanguibacter antarcticus]
MQRSAGTPGPTPSTAPSTEVTTQSTPATTEGDATPSRTVIEEPAKVLRIGDLIERLLGEARSAPHPGQHGLHAAPRAVHERHRGWGA